MVAGGFSRYFVLVCWSWLGAIFVTDGLCGSQSRGAAKKIECLRDCSLKKKPHEKVHHHGLKAYVDGVTVKLLVEAVRVNDLEQGSS